MKGDIDFQRIKEQINLKETARRYGIKLDKKGFTCCPFHKEKTPSMKIDKEYFYCFGCHVNGDVFDFVGRLHGLGLIDTVKKLNKDYNLGLGENFSPEMEEQIRDEARLRKANRKYLKEKKEKVKKIADKYETEMRSLIQIQGKDERETDLIQKRLDVLNDVLDEYMSDNWDTLIYFEARDRFSNGDFLKRKGIGNG